MAIAGSKRSDCVQVVIALIVTPDGLPLAYEVMPGNTSDKTTLRDFLQRIETQYGKAGRTWCDGPRDPDRGGTGGDAGGGDPYPLLVGTPRGRLSQLEQAFLAKPWAEVRRRCRSSWWNRTGTRSRPRSGARRDKEQA